MELLMMQGYRAAHGSVAHWREQMAVIDRLSRLLFDRIPFVPLPQEYNVTRG